MPRISDSQLKDAIAATSTPNGSQRVKSAPASSKRPPVSRVFPATPMSRSPSNSSSKARSQSPAPRVHVTAATAAVAAGAPRNARRENEWAKQNLDHPAPIPIPFIRKARSVDHSVQYAPSEPSEVGSVGSLESIEVSHATVMPSSVKSSDTSSYKVRRSGSVVSTASSVKSGGSSKPKPPTPKSSAPRVSPSEITVSVCPSCLEAAKNNDPIAIELQANDRALRKIMDLEISNTSLLAVNTSLETTIRKQSQLIEQMRHEIAKLKGLEIDEDDSVLSEFIDPVLLEEKAVTVAAPDAEDQTELSQSIDPETETGDATPKLTSTEDEQAQKEAQIVYARVCAVIEQLTADGRKAVEYRAPMHEVDIAVVSDDQFNKVEVPVPTVPTSRAFATLGRSAGVLRRNSSFPAPTPPAKVDKLKRRSAGYVPSDSHHNPPHATRRHSSTSANSSSSASSPPQSPVPPHSPRATPSPTTATAPSSSATTTNNPSRPSRFTTPPYAATRANSYPTNTSPHPHGAHGTHYPTPSTILFSGGCGGAGDDIDASLDVLRREMEMDDGSGASAIIRYAASSRGCGRVTGAGGGGGKGEKTGGGGGGGGGGVGVGLGGGRAG
ncbi:hypothetical protein HDV00_004593, partial [Rhizophlyctis rosea]